MKFSEEHARRGERRPTEKRIRRKYVEEMHWNRVLARKGRYDFVVVLDGLKPTFNIGKIYRCAQALGAAEVHLVGIGDFNPYPAMGSVRYVVTRIFARLPESLADLAARGYAVHALEAPVAPRDPAAARSELAPAPAGGTLLTRTELPRASAFILGHEDRGISVDLDLHPEVRRVAIPMAGAVESLNVSVAASIAMYEYVRQWESRV